MTSSGHNASETPDKKSLLGAFRSLTSARSKSSVQTSQSPATSLTPVQAAFARHHAKATVYPVSHFSRTNEERERRGGGDYATVGSPGTAYQAEGVLGGPSGLGKLLNQLDAEHTVSERIAAAKGICLILEQYPVNNILAIWSAAQDLLDDEYTAEAAGAGHKLLATCVKQPNLTSLERSTFFEAISTPEDEMDFDTRFQILTVLTSNGKNVEAIETSIMAFLTRLLDSTFESVTRARKEKKSSNSKSDSKFKEETDFSRLFQYIVDFTRFNSRIIGEDVTYLLEQILSICKKTTSELDIELATKTVDVLLTYTYVPEPALRSCIEILCDIFRQLKALQNQTWLTLSNLFRSHLGQLAVSELLKILREFRDRSQLNAVRGAVHVLQKLVLMDEEEGLPTVSLSLLFPALLDSLSMENKKLEADILQFVSVILATSNLVTILLEEDDWSYLNEILMKCYRPQQRSRKVDSLAPEAPSRDSATSKVSDSETPGSADAMARIITSLTELSKDMDFVQKSSVMTLFMRLGNEVSDEAAASLIEYCDTERLLIPSSDNWLDNSRTVIGAILRDQSRPAPIRISLLGILKGSYSIIECLGSEVAEDYAATILDTIPSESEHTVLEELVDFAVNVWVSSSETMISRIVDLFREAVFEQKRPVSIPVPSLSFWTSSVSLSSSPQSRGSVGNILTKAMVRMFLRSVNHSERSARLLFDLLLEIARSRPCETDARISALKLLSRIRADSNYAIFLISSSESQNLAASLCRTVETAHSVYSEDEGKDQRQMLAEESGSMRMSRASSNSLSHLSSAKQTSRSAGSRHGQSKSPLPLWMYPGPYGLPEEPPTSSSHLLFSHLTPPSEDDERSQRRSILPVNRWIEYAISVLEEGADWEVYSYILVHIGAQLSNHSVFAGAIELVKRLRSLLCDHLKNNSYREPPASTGLRKADIAICIVHILTMLISYKSRFKKEEQDDMVKMFYLGIGSGDRTSRYCIHALSICCHELPLSLSKSLEPILQKLSQIITQAQVAIHVLEFLAGLPRLPELCKNFRDEEYRTVFGICARYLQYVRDQKEKSAGQQYSRTSHPTLRHSGPSRDFASIPEQDASAKVRTSTDDLPQYVYALAFHVITFWFMSLKLQDRPRHMVWIARNLVYADPSGREVLEDQAQVTIDMMQRVAYSDRDETIPDAEFSKSSDGEVFKKSWIVGLSIVTVETAARTGVSQITHRRPSSTRYSLYRPLLTQPPRHQIPLTTGIAAEVFYSSSYIGILPEDVFQQFYSPVNFPPAGGFIPEVAAPIPDDEATRRALSGFDRNFTVDSHKVGVIYIGHQQSKEFDILSNVTGSADYSTFMEGLGSLTKLKDAKFNTQGLDHEFNSDGEFTYCWRDRLTEIVFHITTMMPTNLEDDPQCTNKKRHIGNDFVNIIFNDSGLPFKFDTFPSAFNYVYIVITPEARASFVESRLRPQDPSRLIFKVHVMSRPDFPEISPASEAKLISAANLPAFVRLLALNASVFSLVWANREGGEHVSSWRNRLREIKRLRERFCEQANISSAQHTPPGTSHSSGNQGYSSPTPARESVGAFRRTSVATFLSEGTNRSSILSTTTEMERQGSDSSRT